MILAHKWGADTNRFGKKEHHRSDVVLFRRSAKSLIFRDQHNWRLHENIPGGVYQEHLFSFSWRGG
jgi:hypothetical protein